MNKNTKEICSACGTSPVNHNFLFVSNIVEEMMGQADKVFLNIKFVLRLDTLAYYVEKFLHVLLSTAGVIRYNTDIEKASTGRSKLIWEEARRRDIPMEQVVVFGKHVDSYRARIRDNSWFYFESLPIPPWLPQKGYYWADDKSILSEKLKKAGIPSPATKILKQWRGATKAFGELQKPLIIKPKHGSRSRHTTTNINTLQELKDAFYLAYKITPYMVLQEHLFGSVYRATVINNELVGFFRADPPTVTGDGKKNIEQLISEKNKNHHEKLSDILIQEELINFIKRQGYTLESILPNAKTIDLIAKTGRMYGGYTREMLGEVHPKMHEIFKKAGEVVNAPVLGFDLIIEDPTQDPDLQRWGIIECNTLPYIDLHYFALEGPVINLAENVWDLWQKNN